MMSPFPVDFEDEMRPLPLGFMSPTLQALASSPSFSAGLAPSIPPLTLTPSAYSNEDHSGDKMDVDGPTFFNYDDTQSIEDDNLFGTSLDSGDQHSTHLMSPMVSSFQDPFTSLEQRKPKLTISTDFETSYLRGDGSPNEGIAQTMIPNPSFSSDECPSPPPRLYTRSLSVASHSPELTPAPEPYDQIVFSVTTYRWKEIDDCVNGVPVVEIRPYNKSDGKRYVYVKVKGIDQVQRICDEKNLPMPRARFRVEKCLDNSVLGTLSVRELVEKNEDEIKSDNERVSASNSENPLNSSVGILSNGFDSSLENSINSSYNGDIGSDLIELSPNLTLLVSENIVRQLDDEGIGKGSPPPEEHKLRIIVSLVIDEDIKSDCDNAGFEYSVLPFFRIKRRQKRRPSRSSGRGSMDSTSVMKRSRPTAFKKGSRVKAPKLSHSPDGVDLHEDPLNFSIPTALINTAPNSKHVVNVFCACCGPDSNVKLVDSDNIFFVNSSANEIWAESASKHCQLKIVSKTQSFIQCEVFCRECETVLGDYFRYENPDHVSSTSFASVSEFSKNGKRKEAFKFHVVDPIDMNPLVYCQWNKNIEFEDIEFADFNYSKYHESHPLMDCAGAIEFVRDKAAEGWIARPLLRKEFPNVKGGYTSMEDVKPVTSSPSPIITSTPEEHLWELLHTLKCESDAAWACKSLLTESDRSSSLKKLSPVVEHVDIRRLMQKIESNDESAERTIWQKQLFETVYTLIFG